MRTRALVIAALAGTLLFPAASRADDSTFRVVVDGDDGSRVDIQLPGGWITGLLAAATIHCHSDADDDAVRMARSLARQGEGGVYSWTEDDGKEVVARRSRGQLKIETRERDGERASVEMPWVLAECVMLGHEPAEGLGHALARDGVHIRVRGSDEDGSVRIVLDEGDDH